MLRFSLVIWVIELARIRTHEEAILSGKGDHKTLPAVSYEW